MKILGDGCLPWARGMDSAVAMAQADMCLQSAEGIWASLGEMVVGPTPRRKSRRDEDARVAGRSHKMV